MKQEFVKNAAGEGGTICFGTAETGKEDGGRLTCWSIFGPFDSWEGATHDLVSDACANGQQMKCLTEIDEYSRDWGNSATLNWGALCAR